MFEGTVDLNQQSPVLGRPVNLDMDASSTKNCSFPTVIVLPSYELAKVSETYW
jgi:hypothetical protein